MSNTVFILGAGASRDAGAPLMADFIDAADQLQKRGVLGKSVLADFDQVFEVRGALQSVFSKAALDISNIESLFAAFEMIDLLGLDMADANVRNLPSAMRNLIVHTLELGIKYPTTRKNAESIGKIHPPVPYETFLELSQKMMSARVSVSFITFNYDIALDFALHRLGPLDYCLNSEHTLDAIPIMKLHGSVNWARCEKCKSILPYNLGEFFGKRIFDIRDGGEIDIPISQRLNEKVCCEKELKCEPVIVPPTWNKTSLHKEISQVWRSAAKHLREAENIYVMGYSFPESDPFFRYLYALGTVSRTFLKRFWVFDPDRKIEARYKSLLGATALEKFEFIPSTFKEAIPALTYRLKL
jgi:hypothetical protein